MINKILITLSLQKVDRIKNIKKKSCEYLRIFPFVCLAAVATTAGRANPILGVTDPTSNWHVVNFTNLNDPINDQQTGQGDADIVGSPLNPAFYSNFDGTWPA